MPELPEVESLRHGLEHAIIGQKIKKVAVHKPKLVSGKGNARLASQKKTREFMNGLTGEKFLSIERRAKNLIFQLSRGKVLLAHLKMSGQFAYKGARDARKKKPLIGGHPIQISEEELPNKHTHIIFTLAHGTLYYNDTRMFGYLLYYPSTKAFEAENHFTLLGVEPLSKEFAIKYFYDALKRKKSKIKSVLMEQTVVTGLGNIYADECLFESGIRPDRSANLVSLPEARKLHQAIVRILRRAIKLGGSSVATYRLLDETRGNYAREHKVYGKSGEKCPKCQKPLRKILIQNRTTVFCHMCQK
jgi:formamidopyrimidine-DNA glycosylase